MMPELPSKARTHPSRAAALPASLIVLCAGLLTQSGCARDPFAFDKDVDRLMREADEATGAPAGTTSIARVRDNETTRDRAALRPGTTNPEVGALSYQRASPERDVNARLQKFATEDGGLPTGAEAAPQSRVLTLSEVLSVSQKSGREYLSAEESYMIAAIRLLIERHLWGPRFFNDLTTGISGSGDEGDYDHAASIVNTLRATRRLPSGGSLEARAIFNATDQLRERASDEYVQSSRLVLSADIPLLRGAGESAREDLIQAERDLVYEARDFERFRREYLVSIANDYFNLLQSRSAITNQEVQLKSLERLAEATSQRVLAGRREAFEADLARNRVLQAQADLAQLRERYILQLDRFKVRLGFGVDERISLDSQVFDLPEPDIGTDEAAKLALLYRLDLQNQRDRLDDARRAVRNAKNELLPDLTIAGDVTVPTDNGDDTGGLDPDVHELDYDLSATLSLPLDREAERLRLRQSMISLERAKRDYEQARDEVIVSVRAALRNIEQARFQLRLAEQQVEINTRRLEGQRLKADEVDPQTVVDAENDKLAAENTRDRALTALRNAVLNYLLESDQLRVGRDGQLEVPGATEVR